jgi:hypothetical protein
MSTSRSPRSLIRLSPIVLFWIEFVRERFQLPLLQPKLDQATRSSRGNTTSRLTILTTVETYPKTSLFYVESRVLSQVILRATGTIQQITDLLRNNGHYRL